MHKNSKLEYSYVNESVDYKDNTYKRLLNCKCVIKEINRNLKNHLVKKLIGYKDKNTHNKSVF